MKKISLIFAALSLVAIPAGAEAAPCKDAKGKFIKCPAPPTPKAPTASAAKQPPKATPTVKTPPAAPGKAKQCRDAKGRFAKCK